MSIFTDVKTTYQHFDAKAYRPLSEARPSLAATLGTASFGDENAVFTERSLPGHGHEDTFGVLARNGPDAYTLTVMKGSGRTLATAALESGNDLFQDWTPAPSRTL